MSKLGEAETALNYMIALQLVHVDLGGDSYLNTDVLSKLLFALQYYNSSLMQGLVGEKKYV